MFGKTTWAILGIDTKEEDKFKALLDANKDEAHNLVNVDKALREDGGAAVCLSSYMYPLGDESETLECEISPGVYGVWLTLLREKSLMDPAVLKEHLSYNFYTTPFKFLPKESKDDIVSLVDGEPRQVERIAAPMVVDFNTGYLWISTTSKVLLETLRTYLADNDISSDSLAFDFGQNSWPKTVLQTVVDGTMYQDEFLERAQAVKAAGNPKMVEPNEDALLEKILKKFFRCVEHDGYLLYLQAPAKVHFSNEVTTVTVATPWDATEVLTQGGLGVASARLTVMESNSDRLDQLVSLDVSDATRTESGYALLKGLECHDLHKSIKESALAANGKLEIKDYWACDYVCNQVALGRYIELVKSIVGTTPPEGQTYGLTRAPQGSLTEVNA